jgi:CheY-like chemotaxis protein
MLSVADTGTGMTPDVMERAFEPFFTTKPLGQGTGLGLSMIYGFARQSGGQARIDSTIGSGTTVCLFLPRHVAAPGEPSGLVHTPVAAPASAGFAAARAVPGETVLVIDDEPTLRMLMIEVLEELGYSTIQAADGAAGLQVLRSNARVDLLITDIGLPGGINGRQLAEAGRAARPGLKVLFVTGYAEGGDGMVAAGASLITKPFTIETLTSGIRLVLRGG